ncbi:protein of unknown function [Cupriavidus taiwanensis]|uniref:Uncharacterized protein n=1 Tax=Cupriavidus taiwanensis TaxID=164546 RepID=A0A7Z7JDN8_9BURK|nr:protein of unknown function [Cupriavidus taiwanensis]SOZ41542.1 protein of unknown function [Cupriavidus taiwanensis]SPC20944.1 protein of unknown function [Cupriavidus taiwanensis]
MIYQVSQAYSSRLCSIAPRYLEPSSPLSACDWCEGRINGCSGSIKSPWKSSSCLAREDQSGHARHPQACRGSRHRNTGKTISSGKSLDADMDVWRCTYQYGMLGNPPGVGQAVSGWRTQGGAAVREAFASANRGDKEGAAGFAVRVARDAGRYSPCQKRFSANAPSAPAAWRAQA